jgi:hypothetical protein
MICTVKVKVQLFIKKYQEWELPNIIDIFYKEHVIILKNNEGVRYVIPIKNIIGIMEVSAYD